MFNSDIDLDPRAAKFRSPQYRQLITELSIEISTAIPIFAEATVQAARLTDSPVAILTTIGQSGSQISSISGLDRFVGLSTNPNLQLALSGLDYCHTRTIVGEGSFSVANFQDSPQLSQSLLYCVHGIKSYLGLPIMTAARDRLGTISILDFSPRKFNDRDLDLLNLVSRLVASEFERKFLSQAQLNRRVGDLNYPLIRGFDDTLAAIEHDRTEANRNNSLEELLVVSDLQSSSDRSQHNSAKNPPASGTDLTTPARSAGNSVESHHLTYARVQGEIQFKLLTYLAQEFRTPLTAVLGMASVLQQEIYGPLSRKQKDYLGIIHHSGQQLVTIVNEISQLSGFAAQQHTLTLSSVDPEMLCQLALQSLEPIAQKKQQQIILNLADSDPLQPERSKRLWLLDRDKVRQIIYYLSLSALDASASGHQIAIQLEDFTDGLEIQIVTTDSRVRLEDPSEIVGIDNSSSSTIDRSSQPNSDSSIGANIGQDLRIRLGLSLSQALAASHGGKIEPIANGRGYQLSLPSIVGGDRLVSVDRADRA
jgi:signal transduction histidine kinase